MIKTILGIIGVVVGVCLGFYMGVWWAFVGGICMVIEAIRADVLVPQDVAFGIARVIFAGIIGYGSAALVVVPSIALVALGAEDANKQFSCKTEKSP